jgi:hypothetical protein
VEDELWFLLQTESICGLDEVGPELRQRANVSIRLAEYRSWSE